MSSKQDILRLLEMHRGESLSGEDLARQLAVSRNAVWKAVRELQKEGHRIEGVTNKGYCLSPESDVLSPEGIRIHLPKPEHGQEIHVFKTVESTNSVAKEWAMKGASHGTVILAEEQTSGRGRKGRPFFSPPGGGLYISFILRPNLPVNQAVIMTAAAGALTADVLESVKDCTITIKWVNDLFRGDKKIVGILTEAATSWEGGGIDYLVLGIGINVKPLAGDFPEGLERVAGSLFDAGEKPILRNHLAALLIGRVFDFMAALEQNPRQATQDIMAAYRKRSNVLTRKVRITGDPLLTEAMAVDIDDQGFLIVEDGQGLRHTLSSGEVSILPL